MIHKSLFFIFPATWLLLENRVTFDKIQVFTGRVGVFLHREKNTVDAHSEPSPSLRRYLGGCLFSQWRPSSTSPLDLIVWHLKNLLTILAEIEATWTANHLSLSTLLLRTGSKSWLQDTSSLLVVLCEHFLSKLNNISPLRRWKLSVQNFGITGAENTSRYFTNIINGNILNAMYVKETLHFWRIKNCFGHYN